MRVGTLLIHRGYFGMGVVTKVKFMKIKKTRGKYIMVHWIGVEQTNGWLRANNNGLEVLCK